MNNYYFIILSMYILSSLNIAAQPISGGQEDGKEKKEQQKSEQTIKRYSAEFPGKAFIYDTPTKTLIK